MHIDGTGVSALLESIQAADARAGVAMVTLARRYARDARLVAGSRQTVLLSGDRVHRQRAHIMTSRL